MTDGRVVLSAANSNTTRVFLFYLKVYPIRPHIYQCFPLQFQHNRITLTRSDGR